MNIYLNENLARLHREERMADAERYRMHAIVRESAGQGRVSGHHGPGHLLGVSRMSADIARTSTASGGHSPSVHGEDGDLLTINQRSPD